MVGLGPVRGLTDLEPIGPFRSSRGGLAEVGERDEPRGAEVSLFDDPWAPGS